MKNLKRASKLTDDVVAFDAKVMQIMMFQSVNADHMVSSWKKRGKLIYRFVIEAIRLKYGFHKKSFILNTTLVTCPFPSSVTSYEIHTLVENSKLCPLPNHSYPRM